MTTLTRGQYAPLLHRSSAAPHSTLPHRSRSVFLRRDFRQRADYFATPAFKFRALRVIHTRGPQYLFDPDPAHHLALAIRNVLIVADQEKLKRIAVPAISIGVYAYPPEDAVSIIVQAARQMLPRLHYIEEIRFVVREDSLRDIFQHYLRSDA